MNSFHLYLPPIPDSDYFEDEDELDMQDMKTNAFENSEHGSNAVYLDRLDEQMLE